MMIPAIIFLYLWTYGKKNKITLRRSFKINYLPVAISALIFILIIITILILVGSGEQRYAGFDSSLFTIKFVTDFLNAVFDNSLLIPIGLGIIIILEDKLTVRKKISLKFFYETIINNILNISILWILIVLPQFFLYYKTGLQGRYFLPYMLGYTLVLLCIMEKINTSKQIDKFTKYLFSILLIVFLILEIKLNTIPPLTKFAEECRNTTKMSAQLCEGGINLPLLFVMDPILNYHEVYSLKIYLDQLCEKKEFRYSFVQSQYINPYFSQFYSDTALYNNYMKNVVEGLGTSNILDTINKEEKLAGILIFGNLEKTFLEVNPSCINDRNYKRKVFGRFTIYSK